jgi:transcriptional regulator with XRE-family HTH domain
MSLKVEVHSLKQLRNAKQMTLRDVEEKPDGPKRQTLSNWENGHSKPNVQNLEKLANIYDVEPTDLMNLVLSDNDD